MATPSGIQVVLDNDPKSVAWALRSILIGRRDEHRLLGTITDVPVLVIAGEEDSQFPVHAVRRMADAIPTATFKVLLHNGQTPAWISDFLHEIDTLEFGAAFTAHLDQNTEMIFGTARVHAPFTHIFHLDRNDGTAQRIRTLHITAGPVDTDVLL